MRSPTQRSRHRPHHVLTVTIAALTAVVGCTRPSHPVERVFPWLDQAARAHLSAVSAGEIAGDPAKAASLSAGVVGQQDTVSAQEDAGAAAAGNPTPRGADTIAVRAYPLNGGGNDFLAFEKIRFHEDDVLANVVELYHRDSAATAWAAVYRVGLADNSDLPALRLDTKGNGHLLTAAEEAATGANPRDMAMRYAGAVTVRATTATLPPGSFAPGQFTSGEVSDATDSLDTVEPHGQRSRAWEAEPGGAVVAVRDGVLVFAVLKETVLTHYNTEGTVRFFMSQDTRRVSLGGLLQPGEYSDLRQTMSVVIAVVAAPAQAPDVVGRWSQLIAIDGQLSM